MTIPINSGLRKRARRTLTLLLILAAVGARGGEEQFNLIVIVVDTLRADHLGCYGYERPTSPNIDRFASEGILFENAFAQSSWTAPSVASLFTSLYPSEHGVTKFTSSLSDKFPTIANVLRRQGFRTHALSANFVHITKRKGFAQGFDSFDELRKRTGPGEEAEWFGLAAADARAVTTRAVELFRELAGSRFFVYLHYMDPHSSYAAPAPYTARFTHPYDGPFDGTTKQIKRVERGEMPMNEQDLRRLVDLYDGEIAFVDAEIGRLFRELRSLQVFENSVIVLLADHGEEFGEHGGLFHGTTLYDEMIHVPMIMHLPQGRHPPFRAAQVVEVVDLGPTLIRLIGLRDDRATRGQPFFDLLEAGRHEAPTVLALAELHTDPAVEKALLHPKKHRGALVTGNWTYLLGQDGSSELYSREANSRQQTNRAPLEPATVASFAREWSSFSSSAQAEKEKGGEPVPLGPELRERLRALGYLD